ncbi:hypothetical protein ACFSC4_19685 [Deinococcus malanensis]|uniref:hypothetical protein n=1 Tax=Deinococcus malanensis TaxID=1706855 RepID=UPI00364310EA
MPPMPPTLADDPYPHAAYLAVTADGEVIGAAQGHPGSTLVLHFMPDLASGPAQFTLRPHNVPAGRQAPALVCLTSQGVPAVARQKRGGHFVVTCYAERPSRLSFDAVYEAWIWKRLQFMAASPENAARLAAGAAHGSGGGFTPIFRRPPGRVHALASFLCRPSLRTGHVHAASAARVPD